MEKFFLAGFISLKGWFLGCSSFMKSKYLAIVILSYNTKTLLKNCLNSVFNAAGKSKAKFSIKVWVVDNNSSDGTVKMLEDLEKKQRNLKVVYNDKNSGFAEGNNIGIKKAIDDGADKVMILNSDTLAKDDFWSPLVKFLDSNTNVGMVTPKIYFAPGFEFHKDRYAPADIGRVIWSVGAKLDWNNILGNNIGLNEVDKGQFEKPARVEFASGCCLMASSEIWEKVNSFDKRYFMYYEDNDICMRIKKLGKKIYYVPKGRVWHLNAGSSSVGGSIQDYFISRNRMLFGIKWASFRTKFALIRESLRLILSGREWQKTGIKDYYLSNFGIGSWEKHG